MIRIIKKIVGKIKNKTTYPNEFSEQLKYREYITSKIEINENLLNKLRTCKEEILPRIKNEQEELRIMSQLNENEVF